MKIFARTPKAIPAVATIVATDAMLARFEAQAKGIKEAAACIDARCNCSK